MRKTLSVFLLGCTTILPIILLVVLSYWGSAHPLEEKKISDISFLSGSNHKIEIVFFGYVGCPSVCPTSLAKLASILDTLPQSYASDIGANFVNISSNKQHTSARQYGRHFSDKIKGINISEQELEKLATSFSIRVTESYSNPDQLFHTDHFFILQKEQEQWGIARVLAYQSDPSTISRAIITTLKQMD